jgi:hypothetical protein
MPKNTPKKTTTSKPAAKAAPAAMASSRIKRPAKIAAGATATRAAGESASLLIDQRIRELADWRGETLARLRSLILQAVPGMTEEWKWMGTPVWSHAGNVCTGETYKQVVKLTFARGASLPDPKGLFNSSLEGNTRRAIDIREGEVVDSKAFKALIKAAVAENLRVRDTKAKAVKKAANQGSQPPKPTRPSKSAGAAGQTSRVRKSEKAVLLSGANPQIAKAEGDAPIQAYIAAMPGWKSRLGQRLDELIERSVPNVRKAVKWNSPFYGVEGQGWFLSFHVFTQYVKVTFFSGRSLIPIPPGGTEKSRDARWLDIRETDTLDEVQMVTWIKQAASVPGWTP